MSDETVRGRIRNFLLDHIALIQGPVLEVGSLLPMTNGGYAFWAYNRNLVEKETEWLGLDFQAGNNVDVVADIENETKLPSDYFQTVLCSEVMEHLYKPWDALKEMHRLLKKDGYILITTLFSFPIHGYPDDYWRYSPSCMERLMKDAGFRDIKVLTAGNNTFALANDVAGAFEYKDVPMHIFAVGRK
jgi:predicted SAM-dependent methyltransferase